MADYENLLDSIDAVIKSNNRREITGQILQNTLHQMVGSLGENYQLAGFATPTLDPNSPDQNVFYITDEAGVYTNFDNITLGAGLSFLMWKNEEWTSKTLDIVTADWLDEHYVSKAFLRKVFQFFDEDGVEIFPNDTEGVVDNIKAMCGLWTNEYLSALGLGEGSTIPTTLAALNDVTITNPQDGQALVYDAASLHWVNATIQSGVDMSVVWAALAGATNEQINVSHLTTALNDYVTATSLATTLQSYVTTSALATELANYASQNWVETNYVSKAFFNSLFEAQDVNGNAITPNNSGQTTIDRLKILVGAYTEQYLSALGLSSSGGGGGSSTLAGLNDVTITNPQDGQALIYDAESSHWVNGAAISMSAVWTALAAATSEQINSSHLTSALSGYVTTSALASELANYVTTSSLATTLADYVTTSALATTLADYGSKTWVDNNYVSKAFFNRLFQAFAPLAEGQTEPTQVEPNDTTTTIDNIKAMFGLWTEQYLSALGLSAGGGHTIGVLNDLNDVTITNPQNDQVLKYNNGIWVNAAAPSGASALSGLTDVAISTLADKDLLQWDYASGKWKNVVLSTVMSGYATTSQLANYLPLSGGTMTGILHFTTSAALPENTNPKNFLVLDDFNNGGAVKWARISNIQTSLGLGSLAYKSSLTASDIPALDYLPLSGGTMTGTLVLGYGVRIDCAGGETLMAFKSSAMGGVPSDAFGVGYGYASTYIRGNGNLYHYKGSTAETLTIWDSGNDGSGSGLDADLLDGQHGSYYATASSLNNYLPLTGGTLSNTDVILTLNNPLGGDSGLLLKRSVNTAWRILDKGGNLYFTDMATNTDIVVMKEISQGGTMYVRGNEVITAGNIGSQSVSYATSAGSASSATTAAACSGNAATATTLQTSRTLWGQSFNGNANVSGNMSSVGTINGAVSITEGDSTLPLLNITRVLSGTDYISMYVTATHRPLVLQLNAGNVGIGVAYPTYKLHVAGDIYATGGVTAASDERLKDVYDNISLSVEQIANAPAVRFYWKADHSKGLQAGTLAQYWQSVLPEVVSDRNNELGMQYGVTALVSVVGVAREVMSQKEEIEMLKNKVNELGKENEYLREEIERLKVA